MFGSGKTKFLERLRDELPGRHENALTFAIKLGAADKPRGSEGLTNASLRFCDLVGELVAGYVDHERRQKRTEEAANRTMQAVTLSLVEARKPTDVNVSATTRTLWGKFENSNVSNVSVQLGDVFTIDQIVKKQTQLAEVFASVLTDALGGRRALLTIDGFEHVAGTPLGDWLIHLVEGLEATLAVVARTPAAMKPETTEADVVTTPLPPLTRTEIERVLQEHLETTSVDQRLVDVVADFCDGHAHTVTLVAELVRRLEPAAREADAVKKLLQKLPDDFAKELGDLVEQILVQDGAAVAELVRKCSVLRRFDAGLLEAFAGLDEGQGKQALAELDGYSFIERVGGSGEGFFAVHDFIRTELERRLFASDPEGARKLHRLAAVHISNWLNAYEEAEVSKDRRTYGAWYRYERPEWRAAAQEWLYHEARAASGPGTKRQKEQARLRFARIFFDAFWWWGCYREFWPIPALLTDWRETQADVAWTSHLETFLEAYPTGWEKDADPDRWQRVEQSLLMVRAACGLTGNPAQDDEEQAHVRGLLENFSAHAARYAQAADDDTRGRAYEKACAHYDRAVQIFEEQEDDWDRAWTLFERAELHFEHGAAAARGDWSEAVRLLPELGDDELTANLYRLAADARWPGDRLAAFALHGKAILHAYLFQNRYQGQRYRPDAYTLDFYAEQIERAVRRLIEHAKDGDDVDAAVAALTAGLPAGDALDPEAVARACATDDHTELARLFPAPPAADDLENDESEFQVEWEQKVGKIGEPATVVPPDAW